MVEEIYMSSNGTKIVYFLRCVYMRCSLFPELSTVEHVDLLLLKHDSGVESALLYAKAWSKYTKDMLAWVEKRLSLGQSILKA